MEKMDQGINLNCKIKEEQEDDDDDDTEIDSQFETEEQQITGSSINKNKILNSDLDQKLKESLTKLDSLRISKYRCPLEELFHNWTFFVDNINLIYWSCLPSSQQLPNINSQDPDQLLLEMQPKVKIFIKKFWLFMDQFLLLFKSNSADDHAVIELVKNMSRSIMKSPMTSIQILLLHLGWLESSQTKTINNDGGQSQQQTKWWHNLKSIRSFWSDSGLFNDSKDSNRFSSTKIRFLIMEVLEKIIKIIQSIKINDVELALISAIMILKWTPSEQQHQSYFKENFDGACHICHSPMSRMEQLFIAVLEMFIDDQPTSLCQTTTNPVNPKNKVEEKHSISMVENGPNQMQESQFLFLMLMPEMEYFFTLLRS